MGGALGAAGVSVPQRFEVGDGPFILPPNILRGRCTVIGCEAKCELSANRSQGGNFCFEIEVFVVKKRVICVMLYIRFQTVQTGTRETN